LKKRVDINPLMAKVSHKDMRDKFARADQAMGVNDEPPKYEKIIRKSYSLLKRDVDTIKALNSRLMKNDVRVSDSHIVRLGLTLAANLENHTLIEAVNNIPIVHTGRPRKHK
jgi:tetrahydrodipicolinate N-succinyltransferase